MGWSLQPYTRYLLAPFSAVVVLIGHPSILGFFGVMAR